MGVGREPARGKWDRLLLSSSSAFHGRLDCVIRVRAPHLLLLRQSTTPTRSPGRRLRTVTWFSPLGGSLRTLSGRQTAHRDETASYDPGAVDTSSTLFLQTSAVPAGHFD